MLNLRRALCRHGTVRAWAGLLAASLLIAGCGSSSANSASSAPKDSAKKSSGVAEARKLTAQYEKPPTTISQTVPLIRTPPRGKNFIFLTEGAVPAVVEIGNGEKQAVEAVGWHFSEINYDQSNPASLQSALMDALAEHPTVVALTGSDVSLFGASVISAYEKAKVPIIVSTVGPFTPDPVVIGTPGGPATYANAGKALGAWFVANSDGTGKAILAHEPAFSILDSFTGAFQKEVQSLCSACAVKYVNISVSQAIGGQENGVLVSALQSNPSYKYLIYDEGSFASGIVSALRTAGLADINVAGNDFSTVDAAALRAHTEGAWTGLDLANFGYGVVDIALRYVEGMPRTTGDDAAPTQVLTPSTIGSVTMFQQPANALQQYERLWKVPTT